MEASGTDDVDKLKSRFLSAWRNMKYSWVLKTKTYFRRNSPVLLLGKCYHFKYDESNESSPGSSDSGSVINEEDFGNVEEFRRDFISRIWLTYREDFPPLEGSVWTTDCGWGCTLRTGQMLLAQGLLLHFLGRDWVWPNALDFCDSESPLWPINSSRRVGAALENQWTGNQTNTTSHCKTLTKNDKGKSQAEIYHRKIVSWFADYPLAYFGLHKLVKLGNSSGKTAGDWYGPAVVSHLLRKAIEDSPDPELQGLSIYVAQDCTIYSGDVYDQQCCSGSEKAVLILVPVRLGGERTNVDYFEFVKGILSLEYCVGIIGGKPKQSYYFVGFQDDSLIYMDPHYCQSFVDVSITDFPLESFHCPSPKKMSFKKMDPSCTIGFYCRNPKDFEKATEELTKVMKSSTKPSYPLFTFVNGHARDFDFVSSPVYERSAVFTQDERKSLKRFSTEDFVLL
ncbi:cysteine protease ATG4C [Spea bombifrons]|uniref:cysteine protease ATG4C n=1 Tax=Spea bombifrons TaxID=233779 RepID=UPI00234955CC|nr:cysteine protease ATG4C [Spea bombifrons]